MGNRRLTSGILGCLVVVLAGVSSLSLAGTASEQATSGREDLARFRLLGEYAGEAVLDSQTGLVWEQSPHPTEAIWYRAKTDCGVKVIGGRRGWRLPSFFELMTLVDPSTSGRNGRPLLPAGHPFRADLAGVYWSSDTPEHDPIRAYVVDFVAGDVGTRVKTTRSGLWCVKGSPSQRVAPQPSQRFIRRTLPAGTPVSPSNG